MFSTSSRNGRWNEAPLARALLAEADRMVGGRDAVLVIDDTSLPKKGRHSVGVAPQSLSEVAPVRILLANGAMVGPVASSTTLRVVPLLRFAEEDRGGPRRALILLRGAEEGDRLKGGGGGDRAGDM